MKPLIIWLAAISLFFPEVYGQDSARIYMNKNYESVENPEEAIIIRDALIKDGRYYIADQFADGRKILKGEYNSVDPWTEDGPFVFYDKKGNKYAEGRFVNGAMDGQWIYFDSTGFDTVDYKKEWLEFAGSNEFLMDREITYMNERLDAYIRSHIHYPPQFVMDCISRNIMFKVLITKDKAIKIQADVPNVFISEIYRTFLDAPDSLIYLGKKRKDQFFNQSFNFICEKETMANSADSADCDAPAFVFVEEQATFQGGSLETFREWVQRNLVYPENAVINGLTGRVTLQFTVGSNGKVGCIKMLRSTGFPVLDSEAIRVMFNSPQWQPAKQKGMLVNQQFVMPVIFQIMEVKQPRTQVR
jgi:TonB family protein